MVDVVVPASDKQKENFIDVGFKKKNPREEFIKKLRAYEKPFTAEFKPFCYTCALQDYNDAFERLQRETLRKVGRVNEEDLQLDDLELDKYGKLNYFNLIGTNPIDEMIILNGTKMPQRAYMRHEYRCKPRNHGRTVEMPWYAYTERNKDAAAKNSKV